MISFCMCEMCCRSCASCSMCSCMVASSCRWPRSPLHLSSARPTLRPGSPWALALRSPTTHRLLCELFTAIDALDADLSERVSAIWNQRETAAEGGALLELYKYQLFFQKVLPRFELGSPDSESGVLTVTPQNPDFTGGLDCRHSNNFICAEDKHIIIC